MIVKKGQQHTPEARAKIAAAQRARVSKAGVKTEEVGSTGLPVFGGRVEDELLHQLAGGKAIKVFREMSDNDPVIGSILFAIDMLCRQVNWTVESDSDELQEFVESCLEDMSLTWPDTVSSILTMLVYGWDFEEIVYKYRKGLDQTNATHRSKYTDGKIGWRKLAHRSQDTLWKWELDENGGVKGMWQIAPPKFEPVFIPIEKAALFRTTARKGNPEGRSVLRTAYRPWYFKRRAEENEAIGIERDLVGLPVAWVPAGLLSSSPTTDQSAALAQFKKIVRNVKRDEQEGLVFPLAFDEQGNKLYDFTLVSSGGTRQFDTDKVIARYDQRIAMSVLADFILLGHENVGSKALGVSKIEIFALAVEAWLQSIAEVFNVHLIPRLLKLNGMSLEANTRLIPGRIMRVDLTELGDFITKLSGAGAPLFPDDELENFLRTAGGLPEVPEDREDEQIASLERKQEIIAPPEPASDDEEEEEDEDEDEDKEPKK